MVTCWCRAHGQNDQRAGCPPHELMDLMLIQLVCWVAICRAPFMWRQCPVSILAMFAELLRLEKPALPKMRRLAGIALQASEP